MANEFDRKLIPGFLQTTFTLSLGAAFMSVETMKKPQESVPKMFSEMQALFRIPPDSPEGLQAKARAIAGNFMEKGASCMQEYRKAGQKFTDPD
jgi:hypothetical protein